MWSQCSQNCRSVSLIALQKSSGKANASRHPGCTHTPHAQMVRKLSMSWSERKPKHVFDNSMAYHRRLSTSSSTDRTFEVPTEVFLGCHPHESPQHNQYRKNQRFPFQKIRPYVYTTCICSHPVMQYQGSTSTFSLGCTSFA